MVMFSDVVAVEAGCFCLRYPLKPVPVLLIQRDIASTFQMVEDPKFYAHGTVLPFAACEIHT
jgi:hypothetical protein